MKKDKWDEELKKRIKGAVQDADDRLVWAFIQEDREYQRQTNLVYSQKRGKEIHNYIMESARKGLIKRLPTIGQIYNCFEVVYKRLSFKKGKDAVDYAYAVAKTIHSLMKKKLEGER